MSAAAEWSIRAHPLTGPPLKHDLYAATPNLVTGSWSESFRAWKGGNGCADLA